MDLRDLIRQTLTSSPSPDPGVIAGEVAAQIPDSDLREALEHTLRSAVREMIRADRQVGLAPPAPIKGGASRRSAMVDGVRDGWKAQMRNRESVNGDWKFTANLTYADLCDLAAQRRSLAHRNLARAELYERWAELLIEHMAATVGELPAAVQRGMLGRAA